MLSLLKKSKNNLTVFNGNLKLFAPEKLVKNTMSLSQNDSYEYEETKQIFSLWRLEFQHLSYVSSQGNLLYFVSKILFYQISNTTLKISQ